MSAALLGLLTWIDYATGYELELFALYILPVGIAAWWGSRRGGLAVSVAGAVCWYVSDRLSGHPYSVPLLIYWSAFMRLVAYVVAALALSAIQEQARRREALLHVVSHDLRTPLAALAGQAQILRKRAGADPWVVERAEAILRASSRMTRMVEDLLDGALQESGKLRLDLEPVDLHAFLGETLARLAGVLDVQRIDVALPGGQRLVVVADAARLERILVNLLSNALKYSPEGTRVRVEAEARGGRVVVSVADQGPGIPESDLPRLFERFFRGAGEGRAKGAGLGLYGARLLVEAHGGTLRAENAPEGGAIFRVELRAD
ncbi:MAG TPA: ATP-binding protein [Anaeromyxobacteraceae bacterium]|nr:ATP-binding protein [Anaeromyxobacteraceae bacterium]